MDHRKVTPLYSRGTCAQTFQTLRYELISITHNAINEFLATGNVIDESGNHATGPGP
jgi:hypothetical protein